MNYRFLKSAKDLLMSQLSVLAERLGGRPREEWFSDIFYMDCQERHTSERKCVTREKIAVEKEKTKS